MPLTNRPYPLGRFFTMNTARFEGEDLPQAIMRGGLAKSDALSRPSKAKGASEPDDLSWREVGQLGWTYLKIPAALLLIEALYWFITQPSDTLAPIQVTEAWIWSHLTNLIFGEGTATLSYHNDWLTRVDFNNAVFPHGVVALYVSDECAGIHEMLFISTLVLLTERVPWKLKMRTIAVMCGVVYVLNIVRLLVLYPLAYDGCAADPRGLHCVQDMWYFHKFVYEWGFLAVLLLMWVAWFYWVGGPKRVSAASTEAKGPLQIRWNDTWSNLQWATAILGIILVLIAFEIVLTDSDFATARVAMDQCDAFAEVSQSCANAEQAWNDELGYIWSMLVIGGIGIGYSVLDISRRDESEPVDIDSANADSEE
ncbi:MAG: exosortase/archaeosortase family protein [Euryarchaeota archaeon]|nr:exosortase/archaeosortase family protein [Euryarchaeota archaeon]